MLLNGLGITTVGFMIDLTIEVKKVITIPKVNGYSLSKINNDLSAFFKEKGFYISKHHSKGTALIQHYSKPLSKNHIDGVGDKWHITCTGVLDVNDGIAHIRVKKPDNSVRRHLYKTISYRILGTLATVFVAHALGAPVELSMIIGVGELVLKPILYFLHERLWFRFR